MFESCVFLFFSEWIEKFPFHADSTTVALLAVWRRENPKIKKCRERKRKVFSLYAALYSKFTFPSFSCVSLASLLILFLFPVLSTPGLWWWRNVETHSSEEGKLHFFHSSFLTLLARCMLLTISNCFNLSSSVLQTANFSERRKSSWRREKEEGKIHCSPAPTQMIS